MRYLPLKVALRSLPLLFTGLFLTGCYYPTDGQAPAYPTETQPAYAPQPYLPTALVIVVEGECTQEEYRARRSEIVNYLIERGYIASESDLVSDPADASRIIRAIVSNGGFTLSVFNQEQTPEPPPDLEYTDILYPADPYFIFGFGYVCEIGPRRLPPRPRDYHPHPRPPHHEPPPGWRTYDHDRHWARPGEPRHPDDHRAPPTDRRHNDDKSHPGQKDHPPAPNPDKKPTDHPQPRPDDHGQPPPPAGPVKPADRPRLGDNHHPVIPPGSPKPDDHPQSNNNGHPPKPADQSHPDGNQPPPRTTSPNTNDTSKPATTGNPYQRGGPGANYRPPTPPSAKSVPPPPDTKTPPPPSDTTKNNDRNNPPADDNRDRRRSQN